MRIRVAVLDKDISYLNMLVSAFGTKYADKVELYSFSDSEVALSELAKTRVDILLIDKGSSIDTADLSKKISIAYLVDSVDVDRVNGVKAIYKYQKIDLLYKSILDSFNPDEPVIRKKNSDNSADFCLFWSPSGGAGTSTLAVAYAIYNALHNKRVLYLNFEKYGSADIFFNGPGQFCMSDVIFAAKKNSNLEIKLESSVKTDNTGVYFYSQTKYALDMLELSPDDQKNIIQTLCESGKYDLVVVDKDFSLEGHEVELLDLADVVVMTGDGSATSNAKFSRAYEAIGMIEQSNDTSILRKVILAYNKYSNKTSSPVEYEEVVIAGGIPRLEHLDSQAVVKKIYNDYSAVLEAINKKLS